MAKADLFPQESQPVEVLTLAWTVSVTTTLLFDLLAVIAHLVVRFAHPADMMRVLHGLAIGGGALIGVISLGLLVAVLRLRATAPPQALIVFGLCVTIAPILAVVIRITGLFSV